MKVTGAKAYEIDALARRSASETQKKPAPSALAESDPSRVSISSDSRARGVLHAERTAQVDRLRDRYLAGNITPEPAAIARHMLEVDET